MATLPPDHADLLDKTTLWHIATPGPDGDLQSSSVRGGWRDAHFVFSLDSMAKKYVGEMGS
jgi:hypothetical protein